VVATVAQLSGMSAVQESQIYKQNLLLAVIKPAQYAIYLVVKDEVNV
jgi:hypothetical protein